MPALDGAGIMSARFKGLLHCTEDRVFHDLHLVLGEEARAVGDEQVWVREIDVPLDRPGQRLPVVVYVFPRFEETGGWDGAAGVRRLSRRPPAVVKSPLLDRPGRAGDLEGHPLVRRTPNGWVCRHQRLRVELEFFQHSSSHRPRPG